jgi:hypothetical protein
MLKAAPKVREIWVVQGKVKRKKPIKFIPNKNANKENRGST